MMLMWRRKRLMLYFGFAQGDSHIGVFHPAMWRHCFQSELRALCMACVLLAAPRLLQAQSEPATPAGSAQIAGQVSQPEPQAGGTATPDQEQSNAPDGNEQDSLTMFPHSETSRYWISGQANIILQWHSSFPAAYTGTNSLRPVGENATSKWFTLFLGYELTPTTEVFLDPESASGHGISSGQGLAGYSNLDVVRITTGVSLGAKPYIARAMLRQIIPLTDERIEAERDELHLATSLPARRIEFRVGKFTLPDFFDNNTWGSDSHLQFLNWTVDANGAWDYAANTRGYTDAAMVEYDDHWWTARFAEALMPKIANGNFLDADIARARAENLELEARGNRIFHRSGTVRLLSYLNHANMGNYREAIDEFLAGETAIPNIIATRRQGRHKYGFGLNFEQELSSDVGVFGRLGWSDGHNESFAYTEVDRTIELGAFSKGSWLHRRSDRMGAAFVANGIVADHQRYLALGGLGFLLGDGALTYGPEKIFEGFYTAHLWRGFFMAFDAQHFNDPGYNRARGPVWVPAVRLHVDF